MSILLLCSIAAFILIHKLRTSILGKRVRVYDVLEDGVLIHRTTDELEATALYKGVSTSGIDHCIELRTYITHHE